jgi:Na+/H+ antiporter NhaD/arsenite permease-like protein
MDLATASGTALFSAVMIAGSNLLSNVPMVMLARPHLGLMPDPHLAWMLTAFVTTVAGNLTLVGSVANIIVAERSRDHYSLGFREYLRFGLVSTVAVLAAGAPIILWLG